MRHLLLMPFLVLTSWADDDSLMTIHRIETETADRMQARVLDPILGAGQSSAFVKLKLEVKREYEYSDRTGEGLATKIKVKNEISLSTAAQTQDLENDPPFEGFGFADSTRSPYQQTNGQKQTQEARQAKGVKEERISVSNQYLRFRVVILHDAKAPAGKLAGVRSALLAIYKQENMDIKFHPVEFAAR
ncbi:MAG: hypothetical protein PHS14_05405 [Elusimicrobia bacterium]|nr:hypothetical protein [Elusimicrobiota bacterium]